jgi:hypothetical protein
MASSGRTGSYLGMTVRVDDCVCCDTANMYHLLDLLFRKFIVGQIIKELPNGYMYQCNSFQSCNDILLDVEQKFCTNFNSIFVSTDFAPIPNSCSNSTSIKESNIVDVTCAKSKDALLRGCKLRISPLIMSTSAELYKSQYNQIQQASKMQIQEAQQECTRQLQQKSQEYQAAIASVSSSKAQLKDEIAKLQKTLATKESELTNVRNDFKRQKLDTEINQIAKSLKDPINRLSAIMSERFPDVTTASGSSSHSYRGYKPKFTAVAVCVVVLLLGVISWLHFGVITNQERCIKSYQEQIEQFEDSISNMTKHTTSASVKPRTNPAYANLRVDIIGASQMKSGETYHFQIKGGDAPTDGKWFVNSVLQESNEYTVKESVGDTLTIEYKTNDQSTIVAGREVTVE